MPYSDYKDMNLIREISNNYPVTIMLVTHTRKMTDSDPLNTISGSTGLIGAVDGVFLLEKNERFSNQGILTISNRDTEEFVFNLEFDRIFCKWKLVNQEKIESVEDEFVLLISDFILR